MPRDPDRFSILRAGEEAPHDLAWVDDEGELDFGSLAEAVRALLPGLAGLDPANDRVCLVPRLDRASLVRILAAIECGLPLALLHPRWSPRELADARARLRPALDLAELAASSRPFRSTARIDPERPLALLFTSGTTGTPRAALLSRRALLAATTASAEVLGWEEADRWLLSMPLAHVGGLSIVLRCLSARKPIVLHGGPIESKALASSMARHAVTLASLVPTMLARLLEGDDAIPPLRALLVGGAACPLPLLSRAIARGLSVRPTYGLTEMCAQVATLRRAATRLDEGVGPPLPGVELSLRDERLRVRGSALFSGFLDEPTPLDAEGFYDTGDHARLDDAGHLHLLGRRSDLVVSGGENVYPAEVEAVLEGIEGIEGACVFGSPDPTWGEVVCAACIATHPPPESEIRRSLTEKLAGFKHPRQLAWVESFVIAGSGKLDRKATAAHAAPHLRPFSPRSSA